MIQSEGEHIEARDILSDNALLVQGDSEIFGVITSSEEVVIWNVYALGYLEILRGYDFPIILWFLFGILFSCSVFEDLVNFFQPFVLIWGPSFIFQK